MGRDFDAPPIDGASYRGRGPTATGPTTRGWRLRGHLFSCLHCGDVLDGDAPRPFACRCGAMHCDPDMLRLGSRDGDDAILVYRKATGDG